MAEEEKASGSETDGTDGTDEPAAAEEPVVETEAPETDEPTAVTLEEPTEVHAAEAEERPAAVRAGTTVGDRRLLAGVGVVIAALAVGAGGYAIGHSSSSSSDFSFDESPAAFVQDRWGPSGDCPDHEAATT